MGTGLLTALDSAISNDITQLGDTNGFVVEYSSTTAVAITSGNIEANGKNYTLAADTTHTMTSLAAAFDFHYIYIDDNASTQPTAVIIDSITEPNFSDSKRGWYNGDDRCIGVVASTTASATIMFFDTLQVSHNFIRYNYGRRNLGSLASAMNPDGNWQTPNVAESSTLCPINSVEMAFEAISGDSSAQCAVGIATAEAVAAASPNDQTLTVGFDVQYYTSYVILGASRNVRIKGNADDDNIMGLNPIGFGISR